MVRPSRWMDLVSAAAQVCNFKAVVARIRITDRCLRRLIPEQQSRDGTLQKEKESREHRCGSNRRERSYKRPPRLAIRAARLESMGAWRAGLRAMPAAAEWTLIRRAHLLAETTRMPEAEAEAMAVQEGSGAIPGT